MEAFGLPILTDNNEKNTSIHLWHHILLLPYGRRGNYEARINTIFNDNNNWNILSTLCQ